MKLIIAIIRPEKLDMVQKGLNSGQATLLSVSQVVGYGQEPGYKEIYRGAVVHTRPSKLRLEIAVDDSGVDDAVNAIVGSASSGRSGRVGDGEIFVMQMDECIHICQGERMPATAAAC